jgi:hypothetical protein
LQRINIWCIIDIVQQVVGVLLDQLLCIVSQCLVDTQDLVCCNQELCYTGTGNRQCAQTQSIRQVLDHKLGVVGVVGVVGVAAAVDRKLKRKSFPTLGTLDPAIELLQR